MSKRDPSSIQVLVEGIKVFTQALGLHANSNKSAMFLAGLSDDKKNEMAKDLQFPLCNLPVKYLGVPLSSKRISVADCDVLVVKMIVKICSWHAKYLTYAARLQLVNAVLTSISSYWCQLFILPKKVLKEVNWVCRAYLWHGDAKNSSPGNVG